MKAKLFGIQDLNFVTADGKKIDGYKLFFGYISENVVGLMCDSRFLKRSMFAVNITGDTISKSLNKDIEIYFDIKGKVCEVKL